MSQKKKAVDGFIDGFANAINDIREKVVEEPWYGKTLNAPQNSQISYNNQQNTAFDSQKIGVSPAIDDTEKSPSFDEYCASMQGQSVDEYQQSKVQEQQQAQEELAHAQEQSQEI